MLDHHIILIIDPGDRVDVFDNYLVGLDVPDHYLLMFGQVVPPDHVLTDLLGLRPLLTHVWLGGPTRPCTYLLGLRRRMS